MSETACARLKLPHRWRIVVHGKPVGFNLGDWWTIAGAERRCATCGLSEAEATKPTPEHAEEPNYGDCF